MILIGNYPNILVNERMYFICTANLLNNVFESLRFDFPPVWDLKQVALRSWPHPLLGGNHKLWRLFLILCTTLGAIISGGVHYHYYYCVLPWGQSESPSQTQFVEMHVPLPHWRLWSVILGIIKVIKVIYHDHYHYPWHHLHPDQITLNSVWEQSLGWHPASSLPSPQSSSPSHWKIEVEIMMDSCIETWIAHHELLAQIDYHLHICQYQENREKYRIAMC